METKQTRNQDAKIANFNKCMMLELSVATPTQAVHTALPLTMNHHKWVE